MPLFKLRSPHYINGAYLHEGTVIEAPESALSIEMEGTDEDTQGMVDRHIDRVLNNVGDHGTGGVNAASLPTHPIIQRQADGTFGEPIAVIEAKSRSEDKNIPQTTVEPPLKPKPSSGGKPVFPMGASK